MSSPPTPTTFFGIPVDFPYSSPYTAQRAVMASAMKCFMRAQNGLLESPTGTGKSLALLSSSLAYQDYVITHRPESQSSVQDSDSEAGPSLTVWYTSRTHTQLRQLITELKKLRYTPQMAFLASRSHLCVHHGVKTSGDIEKGCRKLHHLNHKCDYGKMGGSIPREFRKDGERNKFDLEDLVNYGTEHIRCPYLISREMIKIADLVFAPYPYIIDPNIRKQLSLKLDGNILIIDEAHNIESTCRDSAGISLTMTDIMQGRQLSHMNAAEEPLYPVFIEPFKVLAGILEEIEHFLTQKRAIFSEDAGQRPRFSYLAEPDTSAALAKFHLTLRSWSKIETDLATLAKNDSENPNTEDRFPSEALVALAERVLQVLRHVFSDNGAHVNDFRVVYTYDPDQMNDRFRIICLDPGILFSSLSQRAHSVILSSGTLSPMGPLSAELSTTFTNCISAGHIIEAAQIQSYVITESEDHRGLTSIQRVLQSSSGAIFQGIGAILDALLPRIPGGVLFFAQSKRVINDIVRAWKGTHLWNKLQQHKPIFVEGSHGCSIDAYSDAIRRGDGALLMAVCRGSLSEGVDFSDSQARAVFAFGIPYPSAGEADVVLKKDYNEAKFGPGSAQEWYEAQAFRSLFQAVGRCIRHVRDYGAVILIDERFAKEIDRFPHWMKNSFARGKSIPEIGSKLTEFYAEMEVRFPGEKPAPAISFDALFGLTCMRCTKQIATGVKIVQTQVAFCSSPGFMKAAGDTQGLHVLVLKTEDRKQVMAEEMETVWCESESIAYRPIACACGDIVGVRVHAASRKDDFFLDDLRVIIDRVYAVQGKVSRPLGELVQKQKVMGLELGANGQRMLSFGGT